MEASSYIRSSKEKENVCLFCGEPVEYGWVSDYKGTKVWICRKCVFEGEIGSLIATAILDKDKQDTETLEEINRCLETTQMKLYRNVLYYTFKHPSSSNKIGEGIKEKIEAAETKKKEKPEKQEAKKEKEESSQVDSTKVKSSPEKEKDKLDEGQLLRHLDDWKSIKDIQEQLKIGYKPLLEKLDEMYQKGKVDKRKVKLETGGHKYKYKKISEEKRPSNGDDIHNSYSASETYETYRANKTHKNETNRAQKNSGLQSKQFNQNESLAGAREMPKEDQLLRHLDDWKSIKDIQEQFNVEYKPLQESLNRLFFRGYLLKKTVPDNPMFKRAVSSERA